MILSHKQIEEIAAAVTKDFNEFFFGKDADNERSTAQATPKWNGAPGCLMGVPSTKKPLLNLLTCSISSVVWA